MIRIHRLVFLALLLISPSWAANRLRMSTGRTQRMPALGIRMRIFREQKQVPVPDASSLQYMNRQTQERIEAFVPTDLWRRDQQCALFKGPEGSIHVVELRYLMPKKLPLINDAHVRLEDYRKAVGKEKETWTNEEIREWVKTFVGEIEDEGQVSFVRLRYGHTRFTFKGKSKDHVQGYVVNLEERSPIFLLFEIPENARESRIRSGLSSILRSIEAYRPSKNELGQLADRLQNKDAAGGKSNTFEETRKRVIVSVENMRDWWYVETPNYILKSNLRTRDRRLVLAIQEDIEIVRAAYAHFIPEVKKIEEVSVVTVFADRGDYQNYVPDTLKWSGGAWLPQRRELVISPSGEDRRRMDRDATLRVVYHEAFHQYIYYALNLAQLPIWINEGHAMLFEAAEVDQREKRIEVKENERRMSTLEDMLKDEKVDLKRLMLMSPEEFYAQGGRTENYALAWGLTYFLRKGAWQYEGKDYDKICDRVIQTSIKTRDARKAAFAGIDGVNMEQLTQDFIDFWDSTTKQNRAERYDLFKKK